MFQRFLVVFFICGSCWSTFLFANQRVVLHNVLGDGEDYPMEMLKMALSYSETEYQFQAIPDLVNQERLRNMIVEGEAHIMWAGAKRSIEEVLLPIRIPLFKGLLGHRIFIIRRGDQHRYSQVKSFSELLRFTAGQGRFWSDTPILESSGITVIKPIKYESLFHMLDGSRFDYFPRGVHEPWTEVASRQHELNITVEKELMLIYPMPMYYFVGPDDAMLAKDLSEGLWKAIDDGNFDRVFRSNPNVIKAIEMANMQNRRVFRIDNPDLSEATPLDDKRLWFDLNDI